MGFMLHALPYASGPSAKGFNDLPFSEVLVVSSSGIEVVKVVVVTVASSFNCNGGNNK